MQSSLREFPYHFVWNYSRAYDRQIHNAAQHPVELDMNQVHSVEARIALDLRIGAAFTRLQTLALQNRFGVLKENVVSYGMKEHSSSYSYVAHIKSQVPVSFLPWVSLLLVSTKSKLSDRKPSGIFIWL